jgi:hypothetical protein
LDLIEVGTVHEVHDDEIRTSRGPAQPADRDNTWMIQLGNYLGLADEPLNHPGSVEKGLTKELDGDRAILS